MFNRELDFENALVDLLIADKGWSEVKATKHQESLSF